MSTDDNKKLVCWNPLSAGPLTLTLVKVTRNVTQYPLHHVIYASTEFEVATSKGLGEDTITRNVTDGQTDARMDDGPTLVRN